MYKSEVEEYANYEVYEIVNDKVHIICVCHTFDDAEGIAKRLAYLDKSYDPYYITGIHNPGDMVIGGGYYDRYQKDMTTGKVKHSSLE